MAGPPILFTLRRAMILNRWGSTILWQTQQYSPSRSRTKPGLFGARDPLILDRRLLILLPLQSQGTGTAILTWQVFMEHTRNIDRRPHGIHHTTDTKRHNISQVDRNRKCHHQQELRRSLHCHEVTRALRSSILLDPVTGLCLIKDCQVTQSIAPCHA